MGRDWAETRFLFQFSSSQRNSHPHCVHNVNADNSPFCVSQQPLLTPSPAGTQSAEASAELSLNTKQGFSISALLLLW